MLMIGQCQGSGYHLENESAPNATTEDCDNETRNTWSLASIGMDHADIIAMSGGAVVGGVAEDTTFIVGQGGARVSGGADETFNDVVEVGGGVALSGVASVSLSDIVEIGGGVAVSGRAVLSYYVTGEGGASASGEANVFDFILAQGGASVGGEAKETFDDVIDALGGASVGGEAINERVCVVEALGGILCNGESPITCSSDRFAINSGSVGSATDGLYSPTVTLEATSLIYGDPDKAAQFNGNGYVIIPDHSSINIGDKTAESVELWFNATDSTSRQLLWKEGGSTDGLSIWIESDVIHFAAWSDSKSWSYVEVTSAIEANQTYHAGLLYDGNNTFLHGFVNGELVGTATPGSVLNSHTGNVVIGGNDYDTQWGSGAYTSGPDSYFNGVIDEVAHYSSVVNVWAHALLGSGVKAGATATAGIVWSAEVSGGITLGGLAGGDNSYYPLGGSVGSGSASHTHIARETMSGGGIVSNGLFDNSFQYYDRITNPPFSVNEDLHKFVFIVLLVIDSAATDGVNFLVTEDNGLTELSSKVIRYSSPHLHIAFATDLDRETANIYRVYYKP